VVEKIMGSFLVPEKAVVSVSPGNADSKAVAKDIADSIQQGLEKTYGKSVAVARTTHAQNARRRRESCSPMA